MTSLRTAFFIAYKSIVHGNKSTLGLLIFILSLSFLNLMFITGILNGMTMSIKTAVIETMTGDISIKPQEEPTRKNFIIRQDEVRAQVATVPGVLNTIRHYQLGGSIGYDKERNGVYKYVSAQILGIDPTEESNVLTTESYMVSGSFLDPDDTDSVVLASGLAGGYSLPLEDLGGAKVGDKVHITYANGLVRTYTVKGIYNITFGAAAINALITAKEAESVLSTFNSASQILIKTDSDVRSMESVIEQLRGMFPALKVQGYIELFETIKTFLQAFDIISYVVSAISVVVAAVTIFVLIYVNAVNRRRQIGILKAIGIKENIIVYSYVMQSLFYSVCGIIVGSIFVFGILDPLIRVYPIPLPFGDAYLSFGAMRVTVGVASLLISGFLAGLIPSRIVARENIISAIWG
jgi:putative ABC transport system permease protein